MGVSVNVKSLDEVPEIMREFVTEADGGFDCDAERAFKALKEEREGRRADRRELASFNGLNIAPDVIQAFLDLGRSPEEIASIIENASTDPDENTAKLTAAEKARLAAEGVFGLQKNPLPETMLPWRKKAFPVHSLEGLLPALSVRWYDIRHWSVDHAFIAREKVGLGKEQVRSSCFCPARQKPPPLFFVLLSFLVKRK